MICSCSQCVITRLERRIAQLEAALKPFADKADKFPVESWDDEEFIRVPLSDLRAAHLALNPPQTAPGSLERGDKGEKV